MSKIPQRQVELVRKVQASATPQEQRFARDGFRALFPQQPPTIQQLDGYVGALSMVLTITEGGHLSEPALRGVALMLGVGMDQIVAMVDEFKKGGSGK
jgi:hypothetical protein